MSCRSNSCQVDGSTPSTRTLPPAPPWSGSASPTNLASAKSRTIKLNDLDYGVVGVVERYPLDPVFDNAVIIPASTADADFDVGLEPDTVYVRSDPAFTLETEAALPVAINLGGDIETSTTVLSDALEAEAAADSTLQIIVAAMGLLALIVGGVGIANVMSISVIQRSAEIGIRRALGHGRSLIAWQFLIESVAVGLLGGLAGALVGVGIVVYAAASPGGSSSCHPNSTSSASNCHRTMSVCRRSTSSVWGQHSSRACSPASTRASRQPGSNRSKPSVWADLRRARRPGAFRPQRFFAGCFPWVECGCARLGDHAPRDRRSDRLHHRRDPARAG